MRVLVVEAALALSLSLGLAPMGVMSAMGEGVSAMDEGSVDGWAGDDGAEMGAEDVEDDAEREVDVEETDAEGSGATYDSRYGEEDAVYTVTGDACGGTFEGGEPSLTLVLTQGLPVYGECLWQEACAWEGRELTGWWTDPTDGIMVADAEGRVAVPSLEAFFDQSAEPELVLFAQWETLPGMRVVGICHQRPDGTYDEPDEFAYVEATAGEDLTWSCEETDAFYAVTRTWVDPTDEDLVVEVPRRTWALTLVVDGEVKGCEEILVGAEIDLAGMAADLEAEGYRVIAWRATTPQEEIELGVEDTVLDLVGAGEECALEAILEGEGVIVTFLAGCAPEEVKGSMDEVVVAFDEGSLTLPDCAYVRVGFSFVGWAGDDVLDADLLAAGEALDVAACAGEHITLTAVWESCQVRVSVPVAAALEADEGAGARISRSVLTLENDSETAVELVGVTVVTAKPWRLVAWGSLVEDTDVALALETADGGRLDLFSDEVADAHVRIGGGSASEEVTILCETGETELDGELCSLRWVFRTV